MSLLNNNSQSPSKEGGSPRRSANASTTSINDSSTSTTSAQALGSDKESDDDVDYENEMAVLTSEVIRACSAFASPLTQEQLSKIVFVRKGKYISREAGIETSHDLQIAVIVSPSPVIFSEFSVEAVAELFASVYSQWEWWNERIEFISADQIDMAKMGKSSLLFLQATINAFENSFRKKVAYAVLGILDPETIAPFACAQLNEWMVNNRLNFYSERDKDKELKDTIYQIQTGQGSTISMNRFSNQSSAQDPRILIEKPKPPSSSEFNSKSAAEMITYLRAVETNRLQPEWTLLHTHLDSELAWSWNIRPDDLKASAPSEYKAATNVQLIQWLEHIYARDTHKPKKVRFHEFIDANPLVFDPHKDNNLQEGPFGRLLKMLNNEWKDVCKYVGDKPDQTEEETMVKKLRKNLRLSRCEHSAKDFILNDLDRKIDELWEGSNPFVEPTYIRGNFADYAQYAEHRAKYPEERVRAKAAAKKSIDFTLAALQSIFDKLISKITDVRTILGPSFGLGYKSSSSSSSYSDKQDNNKKRKIDHQQGSTSQSTNNSPQQKFQKLGTCQGCGYERKSQDGKIFCPRNGGSGCINDPRRNMSSESWASSSTGKAWAAKGQKCLPKDPNATLANFVPRTPGAQSAKQDSAKGTEISITTINIVTTNYDNNILPFSLCDIQEERGVEKRSKNEAVFKAAAISHSLLDSGAIGSCVISPKFFDYISTNNYISSIDNVNYNLSAPLTNKSINLNKKYSFTILLKSERPQQPQLVNVIVDAVVAPIPYDLILDRSTIKKYGLVAHFPSHFVEGPLLDEILKLELPPPHQRTLDNASAHNTISVNKHKAE